MTNASLPASSWTRHRFLWPAMAIMLIVGWSSGFIGIRYANEEASVFLLLFWRMLLAGLILLPFALALGPRLSLWAVLWQAGFGVMAMFLYLGDCCPVAARPWRPIEPAAVAGHGDCCRGRADRVL